MAKPSNPKRSGGPRTTAGKLVASANAIKNGAYAKSVILPGENEAEFEGLVAEFTEEYAPQGMTEMMLVRNLAVWWWRLLRLERMEHRHFLDRLKAPPRPYDFEEVFGHIPDGVECFLADPALIDEFDPEAYEHHRLVAERLLTRKTMTEETLVALREEEPFVFEFMACRALDGGHDPTPVGISSARERGAGIDWHSSWPLWLMTLIDESRRVAWAHENREQILAVHVTLKDQRLHQLLHEILPRSAFDFVNRSLYRAIDELRRHQSWRRRSREIDVTPPAGQERVAG